MFILRYNLMYGILIVCFINYSQYNREIDNRTRLVVIKPAYGAYDSMIYRTHVYVCVGIIMILSSIRSFVMLNSIPCVQPRSRNIISYETRQSFETRLVYH